MSTSSSRTTLRSVARPVVAGLVILTGVQGASAEEGLGGFLASIFGGAPQQAASPSSATNTGGRDTAARSFHLRNRPLVVRLHRAKPHGETVLAQVPVKPGKVSIFEDRTLRPGDAVMTAKGVRVFAGSNSWPYAASDFLDLAEAKGLGRDATKELAALDRVPRG